MKSGKLGIIRRNLGSKLIRMEYAPAGSRAWQRSVRTVDTVPEQRNRYSLTDAEVTELAGYAMTIEQHYERPMDIEWGKDGLDGKLYILQARPETVKSRTQGRRRAALQAEGDQHGPRRRPRDRAEDRHRAGPRRPQHRRHGSGAGRRRARHRHDRSELGAGDEAGGRDRHQPRRADLPRRDHRARARHSGGGRLRRRDRDAEGRRAGHRRLLGRRHRLRLRRPARDRDHRRAARRAAVLPDQDHDERRQPAARVRLLPDAEQRRRAGAARVHHQQQHRRPPEGDPRLSEHRQRPEEGGRVGGARPCLAARVLRRQAGRGHRDDRGGVLAEAGDRAAQRLQEQRVPQADRRLALRARGREPDARLSRRVALRQRGVRRGVRDGMRGAAPRARRDGADQRRDHGAVRAHARAGPVGRRDDGGARPEARRRPAAPTGCA